MRRLIARLGRPLPCHEVAAVLQTYVDGEADPSTTKRVRRHLRDCRRCGLERDVYLALKASLARRGDLDGDVLDRLRAFAANLRDDAAGGEVESV